MTRTPSQMIALGTEAPAFSLPDPASDRLVSSADLVLDAGLLVVFWSNHCPYVKHLRDHFARLATDMQGRGIAVVAINSNDVDAYPEDRPEEMVEAGRAVGYTFPYLFDETQEVAKAYRAACTPDFFLFDAERRLVYRGQYDDARPGNNASVTGRDLSAAVEALLGGQPIPVDQRPSLGCNIKWRAGNAPEYA